ncbi:CBS domain-containing protein [Thermovibrio ammonificans]
MGTVITTHRGMDLDALGAVVGLKRLYPEATVVLPSAKGEEVSKLLEENPELLEFVNEEDFKEEVTRLIVADTDSLSRIPETLKKRLLEGVEVKVYDHHSGSTDIPGAELNFKEAGSTTSIVALLLKGKGLTPSPLEASAMLAGIYSDTGSFRYPSTSPLDFLAAAYLMSVGANISFVKKYLPAELSETEIDVLKVLKDNLRVVEVEGNRIGITFARFDRHVGEVAHLVSRLLEALRLPALFAAVEVGGTTFLIGRSRTPKVDAAAALAELGGGGHHEAASATLKGVTAFEALERLEEALRHSVEPLKVVKDIMTSPPITVSADVTVEEARKLLMKNSINAAPVVDSAGTFLGVVTRALLDKAIYMGLGGEPVSSVMDREYETVEPEAPLSAVEELLVLKGQSFVPVVKEGRPVGVVTRTDLLNNLYREELHRLSTFYSKRLSSEPKFRNVKHLLKKALPRELYSLIERIGEVAQELGLNAYLVGGFVRDLVIGRKNFDIDIVVEGDAVTFAKEVAKRLRAKVHTFERFKTATLVFPEGLRIDLASARTELYRSPGALPEVDTAPLKKDLMRRDFTINTLAVKINPSEFGRLIDFFGGLRDIKERKIRVLHSLSFVEDPTRILRALRFATRYRFELGRHTERLLKMAVERKLFKTVEGQRIYHELKQILLEENPLRVFLKLDRYGVLAELFPGLRWNREKKDLFERVRKSVIWHKLNFPKLSPDTDYHLVYLLALFWGEPENRIKEYLAALTLPEKEERELLSLLKRARELLPHLESADRNSTYLSLLESAPEELLIFLSAVSPPEVSEKVREVATRLRYIKPLVSGNDIKALGLKPGPVFSELLRRVKYAVADGELPPDSREEQLAYLKELVDAVKERNNP